MNLKTFINQLPKAELHLHIEGTLEPSLLFRIAKRNGIQLKYSTEEQLSAAYQFNNLQEFLDIYYEGAQVLIHEIDFYDLTLAYLKKCKAQNIVHTELFFDPQTHTERGVAFETVIAGINKACMFAKKEWGMSYALIPNFLRHLSEEEAIATFKTALPYKAMITGFGLDSSEVGNPPQKFERVFKMVREAGFKVVAHAGEEGSAQNVWDAIQLLKVQRIDHGVRSIDDPELVKYLSKTKIPLTVCPTSNLKLKVVNAIKELPIQSFLNHKLLVTLNSDDPAYFGGYLDTNYLEVAEAFKLKKEQIIQLALNSFEASFLSEDQKTIYINKIIEFKNIDITDL